MQTISFQELKRCKYEEIDKIFKDDGEILVQKRGKDAFVMVGIEHYEHLRICELKESINQAREDIESGNYKVITNVKDYTDDIEAKLQKDSSKHEV